MMLDTGGARRPGVNWWMVDPLVQSGKAYGMYPREPPNAREWM